MTKKTKRYWNNEVHDKNMIAMLYVSIDYYFNFLNSKLNIVYVIIYWYKKQEEWPLIFINMR